MKKLAVTMALLAFLTVAVGCTLTGTGTTEDEGATTTTEVTEEVAE